jgi:hypothetical protein
MSFLVEEKRNAENLINVKELCGTLAVVGL